ncbi:hypothetical protein MANES_04G127160v8 [Manihot esculenta]|uniref:Uncharacterized protein n=1 Tax=Manihot esculenta TaxID=3983 RepID=A0ACB7HW81_MANES|nr:hypothetical protein MANES_04G127160v8 [Manihot esculenta]
MAQQNIRIIRDLVYPSFGDFRPSVVRPRVDANNFELKPSLIQMVQQSQFSGQPTKNPYLHLSNFMEISNMIKLNGVSKGAIRLRLFPFSLRDRQLSQVFIEQYIPPGKTVKLRIELTSFTQREDESLHEAWEQYKELQRKCPHHGIPKSAIDVAAGGDLMEKTEDDAYACLDKTVYNNYHCNGERANVKSEAKKPTGMFEIDAM